MSKYCISCGAANADAANVCTRCGKALAGGMSSGGMSSGGMFSGGGYMQRSSQRWQRNGILPLKYQIGSIVMFAYAGITVILMIILLANSDKYMFSTLMHYSGSMYNFSSWDEMKAIYIISVIIICLLSAGIYLHCGFLLRRTLLQRKGALIAYSIFFGISALVALIGLCSADQVKFDEILGLAGAVAACVLLIMKCYDFIEMQKRGTYY